MHEKLNLIQKIKTLLDILHGTEECFIGLTPGKIIVDLEQANSIFLSPFSLVWDLENTCDYTRAFFMPEFVNNSGNSSASSLKNNDNWAFGCICMQILFYSFPLFLSGSKEEQIERIQQFFPIINPEIENIVIRPYENLNRCLQ